MSVLMLGSKGAAVRSLQILLNAAGLSKPLPVTGNFLGQTNTAVMAAQKALGLVVDGKAGAQTLTALKRSVEAPKADARPEPDKSAMLKVDTVIYADFGKVTAKAPPNVASLLLLDTARPIDEIILHCSATREGQDFTVDDIRAWHKARGFSDVGYHYIIYRDGRIMLGRPIGQKGAHCADKGKNERTIGICYIGGVAKDGKTPKDTRTLAQRQSELWLVQQLLAPRPKVVRISGHNKYAAKACPSYDVAGDATGNSFGFAKGRRAA